MSEKKVEYKCNFCGGNLGVTEAQEHDNPNFAQYKTCLKCGYQWAKQYWETDCLRVVE